MAMAAAVTIQARYGWGWGGPAYALSGLTGLERLDPQRHDLADVLVGWAPGYTIAKWITADDGLRLFGLDVAPFVDPEEGTIGLSFSR